MSDLHLSLSPTLYLKHLQLPLLESALASSPSPPFLLRIYPEEVLTLRSASGCRVFVGVRTRSVPEEALRERVKELEEKVGKLLGCGGDGVQWFKVS